MEIIFISAIPSLLDQLHLLLRFWCIMSAPPQCTVLFDDGLPWEESDLVGIDTQFANSGSLLRGFKMVPPGVHLFHYSRNDVRYGTWLVCVEGDVYVARWDKNDEMIRLVDVKSEPLNRTRAIEKAAQLYGMMMEYPEDIGVWNNALVSYIDKEVLEMFLPESFEVTTSTSSFEETMLLKETLSAAGGSEVPHSGSDPESIKYTVLQFKKNRSDDIAAITKDYLDKSWYLDELYGNDADLILAELQLAFANFVILANFCSGYQWVQLVKLVLMSPQWLGRRLSWFVRFLQLLVAQLQKMPSEYLIGPDSIISTESYVEAMENIVQDILPSLDAVCCGRMKMKGSILETWSQIVDVNRKKFDLDLEQLETQDDEDAPQVV